MKFEELSKEHQGYSVGTKEMNTDLRNVYEEADFTDESLEKYKKIVETINEIEG